MADKKRWGMVIDQSRCVGCWTCAVACKEINNQPLGFWWNRVLTAPPASDAKAPASDNVDVPAGEFPNVSLAYQPTACQHCENAPCVKVCPVGATFRRDDGVVLIDYDRCIGCRYCIAACPYGVRVFNWGDAKHTEDFPVGYAEDYRSDGRLVFTPERPRGVVEKCTMCVELLDAGQEPFCVEQCPAGARIFGDLDDPNSAVSKLVNEEGAQRLLDELGTKPDVFYQPATRRDLNDGSAQSESGA
jgi:molybdopterin-containing oxidoreductase family iron-sulfur binding subunit